MTHNFEGHSGRECGDHRTVGPHRAWCFDCHERCCPDSPCKGCELPVLGARITELVEAARVVVAALDDAGRLHATTGGPELAALIAENDAP